MATGNGGNGDLDIAFHMRISAVKVSICCLRYDLELRSCPKLSESSTAALISDVSKYP